MASQYDRLIRFASRAAIPLGVLFEITHRCNLGCVHCYLPERPASRRRPTRPELGLREICRILDELAGAGSLFLTLSGGEVLLRRDWLAIVAHARACGFSVTIFTAGTLLTPAQATHLAALHPLSVEISIYSARAELHDRITRIRGSHARSLRALRLLKERGVAVLIKSPLMRLNATEYRGISALAEELGAGYAFDPLLVPARDGNAAPLDLSLDGAELLEVFADPVLADQFARPARCVPQRGEEICGAGRRTCLIAPNGDVFPCSVHPTCVGNLRERRFREIWEKSPLLHELRATTVDDLGTHTRAGSAFRCSALALIEQGNFLALFPRGERIAEAWAQARLKAPPPLEG